MILSLNDVAQQPSDFQNLIETYEGESLILRPLVPEDVVALTDFLQNLTEKTRKLSTFASYDAVMAQELCDAINRYDKLRFVLDSTEKKIVGLLEFSLDIPAGDSERFKEYGFDLSSNTDCRFGPTLADTYQDKGVGSKILPSLFDLAKRFGKERMILFGGVLAENQRAIHFYLKKGFVLAGEFTNSEGIHCLDMIKVL